MRPCPYLRLLVSTRKPNKIVYMSYKLNSQGIRFVIGKRHKSINKPTIQQHTTQSSSEKNTTFLNHLLHRLLPFPLPSPPSPTCLLSFIALSINTGTLCTALAPL